LLAGLSEFLQQFLANRAATLQDLLIDFVGIGAGTLLALAIAGKFTPFLRVLLGLTGVCLVTAAFYKPFSWAAAYDVRNKNVPALVNFESKWEANFFFTNDASIERTSPPPAWTQKSADGIVGSITYRKGRWPVFKFQEIYPDWRGYSHIKFEMYNAESERIRMTFRVDDVHHNYSQEDRLNHRFWLMPGHNAVSIPLTTIKEAPVGRDMDMSAIKDIMWFASKVEKPLRVYLGDVRLSDHE
ncbi:MAG: hypothetical protein AAF438_03820, partial [Pseudomonadota bacterium]